MILSWGLLLGTSLIVIGLILLGFAVLVVLAGRLP